MSAKRQAETQLDYDNWDQEEPVEKDEGGGFKMAPKEILEKRVIRTAKRRSQATGDTAQNSIFSGFSGFNKTQKTSFDFLANLTNGSKANIEPATLKSDTAVVSSSSVSNKPASSPTSGVFSLSGSSTPITKSVFGQSDSTVFGGTGATPAFTQSVFSSSKPDSTVNDSPLKVQSSVSSTPCNTFSLKSNANPDKSTPQASSNLFGVSSSNVNNNSSPFSAKPNKSSPIATPTTDASPLESKEIKPAKKVVSDENELMYYNNLKALNKSVCAWINKHVEETPLCILSPIFRDYDKHVTNLRLELDKNKKNKSGPKDNEDKKNSVTSGNNLNSTLFNSSPSKSVFSVTPTTTSSTVAKTSSFTFGINTSSTPSTTSSTAVTTSSFSFGINTSSTTSTSSSMGDKTSNFTFGINTSTTTSANNNLATTVTPSTGFSFGIKPTTATTSPFGAKTTTSENNGGTPFSFGVGKPFSFNSNIQKTEEPANEGDANEDEPPKVEYNPIAEENSVYDKKCKVFVKKDGNYVDKGVGTLYIKKIEETGKHQLLVRANTSLGNVLINMILSSSLPTQRMGKNNVMMVCIPTPDAKPPPVSILLRVKTSEDADELLATLNKFKT
ncbi:nuclear pore complex protein Nup50 [Bicyclus anynana]|uniref:Nuclear pore complex protein Nup50 n=1 Tax=Bicyclus anynana TaxID=110368 RepID=A0A6J1NBN9_BICAN|nr:nuclear pore complex protein Nup50 [Bicyclus anynana]